MYTVKSIVKGLTYKTNKGRVVTLTSNQYTGNYKLNSINEPSTKGQLINCKYDKTECSLIVDLIVDSLNNGEYELISYNDLSVSQVAPNRKCYIVKDSNNEVLCYILNDLEIQFPNIMPLTSTQLKNIMFIQELLF